jgi:tRNA1Val (adenine37-N6)-methyltransferase
MSFQFKQFLIQQHQCAQKVSEVACIQGAWTTLPTACKRVLDIGSGTGLLSLMLAQRFDVIIDAIEIDEETFHQGNENIQHSTFSDQINPILGDVNTFHVDTTYDFIITNPPFFEKQLQADSVKGNIAKHSSALTLLALIKKIDELLTDNGQFSILFPYDRKDELEKTCATFSFYPVSFLLIKHSVSHLPKVMVALFGRNEMFVQEEECIIKENGIYTEQMKQLTAAFYL